MKKIILTIIAIICTIVYSDVYAKEFYYQNNDGVKFTEKEYKFLNDFYFEGYQDYMTQDEYNEFIESKIMEGEIQIAYSDNSNMYMPAAEVTHPELGRTIKLSSSCSGSTCVMVITLVWTQNPVIRSYDLIGALVQNTNIINRGNRQLYYSGGSINYTEGRYQTDALSSTYKLPSSGSNIRIVETFTVANSGKVIASYQHATQNISLATSRNYNFSTNGYGAVFAFHSGTGVYYDRMLGVYLILG